MQPMTLLFQKVDHWPRVLCRLPDSDQPSNEAWWQRSRSKVANPCYEISHSCQEWCPARWAGTHMSRSTSMPSWPFFHTPGETWIPTCSSLCSKWVTTFFVRESVQTMALHNGFPVLRLQATVVSRWFVIPTAQLDQHLAHWVFQWPYDSVLASKEPANSPTTLTHSFAHPALSSFWTASSIHVSACRCISSTSCSCHLLFSQPTPQRMKQIR